MIASRELDWRFGTIEVPAADRYIREAIEVTGEYGGHEIDLYQGLLRQGDVVVDVGANIGVFAIAMGLAVGPAGRVLAFEPQPAYSSCCSATWTGTFCLRWSRTVRSSSTSPAGLVSSTSATSRTLGPSISA